MVRILNFKLDLNIVSTSVSLARPNTFFTLVLQDSFTTRKETRGEGGRDVFWCSPELYVRTCEVLFSVFTCCIPITFLSLVLFVQTSDTGKLLFCELNEYITNILYIFFTSRLHLEYVNQPQRTVFVVKIYIFISNKSEFAWIDSPLQFLYFSVIRIKSFFKKTNFYLIQPPHESLEHCRGLKQATAS